MVLDIVSVLIILCILSLVIYKIITDEEVQLAIVFCIISLIIIGIVGWSIYNVAQMLMNG